MPKSADSPRSLRLPDFAMEISRTDEDDDLSLETQELPLPRGADVAARATPTVNKPPLPMTSAVSFEYFFCFCCENYLLFLFTQTKVRV